MPTLRLDGDASGAVKATSAINKEAAKIGPTFDKATASAKQLEKAAFQIVRANQGPLESYNSQMKLLAKLVIAGKLSHDQASIAAKRYHQELVRGTQSTLHGIGLELRARQLQTQMLQRMNAVVGQVGQAQSAAFGAVALQGLTSYLGAMVGPTALLTGAISALRSYRAELAAVGQQIEGNRGGLGQLMTLAMEEKTPALQEAKKAALMSEAKNIFASGATTSLPAAGEFLYQLEQAHLGPKHRKLFAEAAATGVLPEAQTTARSIAALRSAFPDLSPDKLIGMGIYAGIASPGGVDELVQDAAKSAQQIKTLGWKPEFSIAATSLLTKAYPGKGEGGTRLEQFGRQLERFGLQADPALVGMDPLQTLEHIGSKTKGGTDRKALETYVGNRGEAMQGFRTLYGMRRELKELIDGTATADGGFLTGAINLANNTPEINAARQVVASTNQRALDRLDAAQVQQLYQSLLNDSVTGRGAFGTGATETMFYLKSFTEAAQLHQLRQSLEEGAGSPGTQEAIRRHLQSLDAKTRSAPAPNGRQEK